MHNYAQTIVQLYNQLQREGYSTSDSIIIRNTYELAMSIFSGRFQPSGKTFIAHGVGTASVLASLRLPAHPIAAGLIHNVYWNGDFGDGTRGISKAKRKYLRRVVGKEIEEYVARFATLLWNSRSIPTVRDRLNELSSIDRGVVLLRIADTLEHLLDLDVLYYTDAGRQPYISNTHLLVEISESLGFPGLAAELDRMHKGTVLAQVPAELVNQHNKAFVVVPKSYRRRFPVLLVQEFNRLRSAIKLKQLRSLLNSARKGQ